jgi:hypothetical protein
MADAGVTLSTVSISAGAEQDLLQEMARIAGGRHHHCDNPADVPKILVQETKAATGQEAVQSVRVSAYRDLPGLDLRGAPPLAGYALANTKPEAEQLLLAAGRDPLLAWWPQGAGIAVALTSDTGHRWTRPWLSWPGYGAFWSRLVRHAARPPQEDALHLAVACQSDQAVATLQVPAADDRQLQVGQAELRVRRPDGTQTVLAADQQSPTRYAASFPAEALGEYRVQAELRQDDGRTLAAEAVLFRDYLAELQSAETNESLLRAVAEATGGRYHPQPTDLLAPDGRSLTRHTPLWRHFALAAVLLLVVDLALRRVRLA